jgi:hypothetical protein
MLRGWSIAPYFWEGKRGLEVDVDGGGFFLTIDATFLRAPRVLSKTVPLHPTLPHHVSLTNFHPCDLPQSVLRRTSVACCRCHAAFVHIAYRQYLPQSASRPSSVRLSSEISAPTPKGTQGTLKLGCYALEHHHDSRFKNFHNTIASGRQLELGP